MRRSLFGLVTLLAVAGLLLTTGCERENTLRVVTVNQGNVLTADITDVGKIFDKEDSTWYELYVHNPDSVEFELQYVQIGAGLPTWTPFEAIIDKATITYASVIDPEIVYDPVIQSLSISVMSDVTGKKTTKFMMAVITTGWKDKYFPDEPDPYVFEEMDLIKASIKFTGRDEIAQQDLEAKCYLTISLGEYYDEPNSIGR